MTALPIERPLPPGWREEAGEDGACVFLHEDGRTTLCRCAAPRCRAPFVPKHRRQRTCGQRRCQWLVREETPARKATKKARFDRWYQVPEKRKHHIAATLAGRRRRVAADRILAVLADPPVAPFYVGHLYEVGEPDLVAEALAALWYTGRIVALPGDEVALATIPSARYLRLPAPTVALPPSIQPWPMARVMAALRGRERGLTRAELAAAVALSDEAVAEGVEMLGVRVQRRRRARSKETSYRLVPQPRPPHAPRKAAAAPPAPQAPPLPADPWALPSPAFGTHLPGAGFVIHIEPRPVRAVELGQARALHGLITALLDEPHVPGAPAWALVPWHEGSGWGVYLRSEEHVTRLGRREHDGRLFDRPVRMRLGGPIRLRAPAPISAGRYLLRIDAVTPVCVRHNITGSKAKTVHLIPTSENLLSALTQAFPARLGLDGFDPAGAALRLVCRATTAERVRCGQHLGQIRGWTGSVVVEVNAVAAWLLHAAAQVGLGGRTALGVGRVRVTGGGETDVAAVGATRSATLPSGRLHDHRGGRGELPARGGGDGAGGAAGDRARAPVRAAGERGGGRGGGVARTGALAGVVCRPQLGGLRGALSSLRRR